MSKLISRMGRLIALVLIASMLLPAVAKPAKADAIPTTVSISPTINPTRWGNPIVFKIKVDQAGGAADLVNSGSVCLIVLPLVLPWQWVCTPVDSTGSVQIIFPNNLAPGTYKAIVMYSGAQSWDLSNGVTSVDIVPYVPLVEIWGKAGICTRNQPIVVNTAQKSFPIWVLAEDMPFAPAMRDAPSGVAFLYIGDVPAHTDGIYYSDGPIARFASTGSYSTAYFKVPLADFAGKNWSNWTTWDPTGDSFPFDETEVLTPGVYHLKALFSPYLNEVDNPAPGVAHFTTTQSIEDCVIIVTAGGKTKKALPTPTPTAQPVRPQAPAPVSRPSNPPVATAQVASCPPGTQGNPAIGEACLPIPK